MHINVKCVKHCIQETHTTSESSLDQNVTQQNSESLVLKAELRTLKKQFERLSSIHRRCRSQKKKDFVGTQTLTDDELSTDDEVTFAMY